MPTRILAIDWSGAERGAASSIWLAELLDGQVVRLESGRTRDQIAEHLIAEASRDPEMIVGLDFAFSLPGWFLRSRGLESAPELWDLVTRECEDWLRRCEPPFWGRPATKKPRLEADFRATDLAVPAVGGIRPKSVFQIGGAGAVGTGSLRGMPILRRLQDAGFAIWPFDEPRHPLVVEIYPRALTGAVVKSSADNRQRYLAANYPQLPGQARRDAAGSEDAFDALVSALVMSASASELLELRREESHVDRLEGRIWLPRPLDTRHSDGTRDQEFPFASPSSNGGGRPASYDSPPVRQRPNDSSLTRVVPVFDTLKSRNDGWLSALLDLVAEHRTTPGPWRNQDLTLLETCWGRDEKPLLPPVALLSWLIRNLPTHHQLTGSDEATVLRRKLQERDPATIHQALSLLRTRGTGKGWHVLEGATFPDVFLETRDALIVVEGKRTESGPTTDTTWLPGRHQMLRHLDAAWEIRGARSVYGFFVVEAEGDDSNGVPELWTRATRDTLAPTTLAASLPHRSPQEREGIESAFLGCITWQRIVEAFQLAPSLLTPLKSYTR